MEGVSDLALANFENLPDEVKAKVRNDFKRTVKHENVSEYFKHHYNSRSDIVDKWLETCKGYRKGSLEFEEFITLRFILEHLYVVICDGCSSMIFGGAYFSCFECFFQYPSKSYDLCCACFGTKRFQNHNANHVDFYDNQTLQYLSRRMFAEMRNDRDKRIKFIDKAMIDFASDFMECAKSIKTDGWENYFDRILNFDKNQKLGEISSRAKELEEMAVAKEQPTESAKVSLNESIISRATNLAKAEPGSMHETQSEKLIIETPSRAEEIEEMQSSKDQPTDQSDEVSLKESIKSWYNFVKFMQPSEAVKPDHRRVDLTGQIATPTW